MENKIKVGVIFGGETVEHEVSIITAVQAMNSMDEEKYDIIPIYIAKDRTWYTGKMLADIDVYRDFDTLKRYATEVTLCKIDDKFYLQKTKGLFRKIITDLDIVFPIVHGNNAEDGTLAGYLDTIGIPYVGSHVIGSALGQDKVIMKQVMASEKIPVVPLIVSYNSIKMHINSLNHVPIGISIRTKDIYYYDFTYDKINLILANNLGDKIRFIKCLIKELNYIKNTNIVILDFLKIFRNEPESDNYYFTNFDKCFDKISNQLRNEYQNNIYILIGIGLYKSKLNDKNINILNKILENINTYNNSYFIFIDTYANYKNIQVNNWINNINSSNGIWLGEGIHQQIAIHVNNINMEDRQINFPFMGMAIINEQKEIIKCAIDDGDKNE